MHTEDPWQYLGVAIAGGADQDLVFAFLATTGWQLPQTSAMRRHESKERFHARCPYPFRGPCGGPLFAACDLGSAAVATLLLKCRADPREESQVDQWVGNYEEEAWACTTALSTAVARGRISIVEKLFLYLKPVLPDVLRECCYELHNGGVQLWKYDQGVYARGHTILCDAIQTGHPAIVKLLLHSLANPTEPCQWETVRAEEDGSDGAPHDAFALPDQLWITRRKTPLQIAKEMRQGGADQNGIAALLESVVGGQTL